MTESHSGMAVRMEEMSRYVDLHSVVHQTVSAAVAAVVVVAPYVRSALHRILPHPVPVPVRVELGSEIPQIRYPLWAVHRKVAGR